MKFLRLRSPKGIITREPRSRALSASASSLELKSCQIQYMLKIPDERGDHAQLLQPQELALVTACAKVAYF